MPQALAGVISVILIYVIVKRAFGSLAGLISALCLAVTPVFVAASRNNTIDNMLVMVLLFACLALSIAAEKGKFKYLIISMVLVGVGFNVKMLQAYMVVPALYITYLLAANVSVKKRVIHLVVSTFVLVAVSLSWALAVDSISAANRPYVDSSTNNTVMELIVGHNGTERLSLSSSSKGMGEAHQEERDKLLHSLKKTQKLMKVHHLIQKHPIIIPQSFQGNFLGIQVVMAKIWRVVQEDKVLEVEILKEEYSPAPLEVRPLRESQDYFQKYTFRSNMLVYTPCHIWIHSFSY